MTAARRTPLIAAIPKMVFPVLVILPGIIAIALASSPNKGYRLPPVAIRSGAPAAVADIKAAKGVPSDALFDAVSKDIGLKLDKTKFAALVSENAASLCPDDQITARLQDAVAENDYDSIILSMVNGIVRRACWDWR